jgi:peptide/nickel transport system ATP-binding protein
MTLLAVENLSIRVAGGLAVDGVSFDLEPGEVLALLGESGAGKSLTGAALVGLLPTGAALAGGRILLDGDRLDGLDERGWRRLRGRRVGAVFQDPATALDPLQRIGRQLAETLRHHLPLPRAQLAERIGDWLAAVGLPPDRARAYPHELSGGMRQRVAIALAMAPHPEVLVADEPTTALDMPLRAQVAALLRRLALRQRAAVLLISHDLRTVAAAADRVAVMYAGRLVEIGPVALLQSPRHPYTAALLASLPDLDRRRDRLAAIDGTMPAPGAVPAGCAFAPRCPRADARCISTQPALTDGVACWHRLDG